MDCKLLERRFSLSMSRRLGGYAHMGDAIPLTQHMHFTKFQHYNITHKATLASLSHTINNTIKEISHQLNGLLIYVIICTCVSLNTKKA